MKRLFITFNLILFFFSSLVYSNIIKTNKLEFMKHEMGFEYQKTTPFQPISFDSTLVAPFLNNYPKFKHLKPELLKLYRKHQYQFLWYDAKGLNKIANLLLDKINNIDLEGLQTKIPYKDKIEVIFQDSDAVEKPNTEVELLMSSLYFFYVNRVYKGLDPKKIQELGWYLPQKKQSYVNRLDSLLQDPSLIDQKNKDLIGQYYLLKDALQNYRNIEKKGGWNPIEIPPKMKPLKPGDTAEVILKIRKRLYLTNDLKTDSQKKEFDKELMEGLLNYKIRNGFTPDSLLLPKHIKDMNIPVNERIKTIMTNMERCRWISPNMDKTQQFIVVNIPSFTLTFFKDEKPELISKVVVGKIMNKTAVFSGMMSQIIFCPYWNVPPSILKKEILPAIAKNRNYLAQNDMEWFENRVRQRPGPLNALGKIKFVFPNSHFIYLHDTPSKNLFKEELRAFSHGCIRVERPRDLALLVLKDDKNWTVEKIDAAMNRGIERTYNLKTKIPVYIGYFTAWVNNDGTIHFYNDIYKRDEILARLLFE